MPYTEGDVRALAHNLWRARGMETGSPDKDWFAALEQLRSIEHVFLTEKNKSKRSHAEIKRSYGLTGKKL